VLGLGNFILKDDGVGIHAIRHFQRVAPRSCLAVEVGTAVASAVHLLERADRVIAFDAFLAGGAPGSVYSLGENDILNEGVNDSLHEMGLIWTLQTLKARSRQVAIIAAEPETIDYGMELSPSLQAAVPKMVEAAIALISAWTDKPQN
jgi:hydrogenase maturation protease